MQRAVLDRYLICDENESCWLINWTLNARCDEGCFLSRFTITKDYGPLFRDLTPTGSIWYSLRPSVNKLSHLYLNIPDQYTALCDMK